MHDARMPTRHALMKFVESYIFSHAQNEKLVLSIQDKFISVFLGCHQIPSFIFFPNLRTLWEPGKHFALGLSFSIWPIISALHICFYKGFVCVILCVCGLRGCLQTKIITGNIYIFGTLETQHAFRAFIFFPPQLNNLGSLAGILRAQWDVVYCDFSQCVEHVPLSHIF